MESFGLAGFALGFMTVIWWLTRLMSGSSRNAQS